MQVVRNARVPILLLKLPDGIVCDISVNTDNSISHTEFFKSILRARDNLRAFMRLVKYWVKVRHVPAMRDGGLPSIAWMLICVFLCGQCEICYSAKASETKSKRPLPTATCSNSEKSSSSATTGRQSTHFGILHHPYPIVIDFLMFPRRRVRQHQSGTSV